MNKISEKSQEEMFEEYDERFARACRFDKVFGFDHKYTKQHYASAEEIYDKIVNLGLESAYKKYREERRKIKDKTIPVEKPSAQQQWDETHLCGSKCDNTLCEFFLQTDCKDNVVNGKKLDRCCYYCTSENKVRKIGDGGTWTGLSPKFCPKRKALEIKKGDDEMARKMQFDIAITKDMQSAASDSFMDNIRMIDIDDIISNGDNFYEMSDIDLLADDIEREGLRHNLVVVKNGGRYQVKSGHRRLAAIRQLVEQKRSNITKIPCYVDGDKSQAEEKFDLIMLNATQRKYSDADVLHEYEETERTLRALEAEGKPLKGRIRDNIASILKVSPAQVGKIENIKRNAIPEVEQAVKRGVMSISTANEVAKLSDEKQQEIIKENPKVSHKEVKAAHKQEKQPEPPKSVKRQKPDDTFFEDDNNKDVENSRDEPVVKSEKKGSVVYSLVLSFDEMRALSEFINDNLIYADDDDSIASVLDKLHDLIGE